MAALDDQLTALGSKTDFGGTDPQDAPPEAQLASSEFKTTVNAAAAARAAWRQLTAQEHEDGQAKLLKLASSAPNNRDDPRNFVVFQNTGLTNNPKFGVGNPYVAGVGLEAMGVWFTDDTLDGDWLLCFSWERSGTFASVLDGVRRSAFEAFLNHGDHKPIARLFEASSQAMQVGAGGFRVAPGGAVRSGGVLTLTTATVGGSQQVHKMGAGQRLNKEAVPLTGSTGDTANFGANGQGWGPSGADMVISEVVDVHTVRCVDARSNASNTQWLSFSTEPAGDVEYGRGGYGIAEIRAKGATRFKVKESGPMVPSGHSLRGEGGNLLLGRDGADAAEVSADMLHVLEGKDFFNEGTYRSTGWYNGGGQVQTTQEVFVVGTGAGPVDTTLRLIGGKDWMVLNVKNNGQGGVGNNLTVLPSGGDTIDGRASLVIPAYAAARFISVGTDWQVFYHPEPPIPD